MYYYGIADIQAVSRCFCNLHASECNYTLAGDVVCDCQHNTMGKNCESCMPLYNERPWKRGSYVPYDVGTANECVKCECNDHALGCTYNETYGRGICDECLHNTRGYHCELCNYVFYPNMSLPLNDINRCAPCECESLGVQDNNLVCAQTESPTTYIGQCLCKNLVTGRQCDQCVPGYYGLLLGPTPGTCTACTCNLDGTLGQSNTCEQDTGQCPCKQSTEGRICDTCSDGYFSFPTGDPMRECYSCNCNKGGALSPVCDKTFGNCTCRTNIIGEKCNGAAQGSFVPAIDSLAYEPQPGLCSLTSDLYTAENPFDGAGFALCDLTTDDVSLEFDSVSGGMIQKDLQWPYIVAVRYTGNVSYVTGTITVQVTGSTKEDLSPLSVRLGQVMNPGCPLPLGPSAQLSVSFSKGTSMAVLSHPENVTLDARCEYTFSLALQKGEPPTVDNSTTDNPATNDNGTLTRRKRALNIGESSIVIDSLVLLPLLSNSDGSIAYQYYDFADNKTVAEESYLSCLQQVSALSSRQSAIESSPCKEIIFAVAADLYDGAKACECDPDGSENPNATCDSLGGQCPCKPGVSGLGCDTCMPGYFNFTLDGCTPCNCHPSGAEHGACDFNSGQCLCQPNIVLATDDLTLTTTTTTANSTNSTITSSTGDVIVVDGTCSFCKPNFYGIASGSGCAPCQCNEQGSLSLQCDESGQCPCKDSVTGMKCDVCKETYFGFGPNGCSTCNCSVDGSTSLNCDQATGICQCKINAKGDKCDSCQSGFFNLAGYNPDGCQPCFCYGHGVSCTSAVGFQSKIPEVNNPTAADDLLPVLGDQHVSYGQVLTIGLTAAYALDLYNEILVTVMGNSQTLQHIGRNGTILSPGETLLYEVRLLEGEWLMDNGTDNVMPSALDVLGVLANVTDISFITRSAGQAVRVTYLSLETAELMDTASQITQSITFVEECVCLDANNVGGLSCERCATGNKRLNATTATSYDSCVPCDCNGRGATDPPECDELSGICLNCRNGTAGDQCELCADFVIGDECDTCQTEYWGLMADGCRACNCSDPGSTSTVCDTDSGQCDCARNVTGRTCDQCEENFYGLTADGCVECDACYSLIKDDIKPLRNTRDAVAANVTKLENQDMTESLGPFISRFLDAISDTEKLVNFLTSAEESGSEINSQISSLNSTLMSVQNSQHEMETNTSTAIENMLASTESLITAAKQHRSIMETNVKFVYNNLDGLRTSGTVLKQLAQSLKTVEQYLQGLADASTSDQEVIGQLETLNQTVVTAQQLAEAAMAKGQATLKGHQSTTTTLLIVEAALVNLVYKATRSLQTARSLAADSLDLKNMISRLEQTLSKLLAFTIDYATLASRTRNAQFLTSSLKAGLTAESTMFSPSNIRALQTVPLVEELTNQTRLLGGRSSELRSRSNAAEQQSILIQQEANDMIENAQTILTTLTNFQTRALEIEQKANTSLEQVSSVSELSKQLIEQSENLTSTLSVLQQTASAAKETSQQALQIIQQKQQELLALSNTAQQLEARLESLTDVSAERYRIINNTRNNTVVPAQNQCRNVETSVLVFKSELNSTDTAISDTLSEVSNITQRANGILTLIQTLDSIDVSAVQVILNQVATAKSNVNVEDLRSAVTDLRAKQIAQRAEIDRLKALRDNFKERIESIRALQEQITNVV